MSASVRLPAAVLAAGLAALLLACGCARGRVGGEVVGRVYTPAHIEYRSVYVGGHYGHCGYYGGGFVHCYPVEVPPCYELRVRTWKYDDEKHTFKPRVRRVSVSPDVFAAVGTGTWYSREPNPRRYAATRWFSESLKDLPVGARKPVDPAAAARLLAARAAERRAPKPPD
jgi:hypothetical protein